MRILIVDDEVDVGRTIGMLLTRLGHTSEAVSSGVEALSRCAQQPFDVVLTDLGMPGMNGLELAQRLKVMTPGVRIILITGWPVQLSPEQLSECGIEGVIEKPVQLKALLSVVSHSDSSGRDDPP